MRAPENPPSWIGPRPSAAQITALMTCGVVGLLIPGLQPLLLGALVNEHRVATGDIGAIATAELLCMGVTAGLAGSFLKATRLKLIAFAALVAFAAINVATAFAPSTQILALRAAAGVPSGILVWLAISLIARAPTPERWAGAYVSAQTLGQLLVAIVLSTFVMTHSGAAGGFISLAVICALSAVAAFFLPRQLEPLPQAATAGLPNLRGWIALSVSFFILAATSGVWVFLERLSHQAGHRSDIAAQAVSISLGFQVIGGFAATALAGRISWLFALIACALIDIAVFAAFATLPPPTPFIAAAAAMGFVWLFTVPFLVPMTIEADPTRRAALLIGGAQLIGGSLGPLFASFLVTDADARGALGFSGASVALAAVIVLALHATRTR